MSELTLNAFHGVNSSSFLLVSAWLESNYYYVLCAKCKWGLLITLLDSACIHSVVSQESTG